MSVCVCQVQVVCMCVCARARRNCPSTGGLASEGGGLQRLEIAMYAAAFFLCVAPFAVMWYWMATFFTHTQRAAP